VLRIVVRNRIMLVCGLWVVACRGGITDGGSWSKYHLNDIIRVCRIWMNMVGVVNTSFHIW